MKVIKDFQEKWKCALCGKDCEGWGSNPYPIFPDKSTLVCSDCNSIVFHVRLHSAQNGISVGKAIDRKWLAEYKKKGNEDVAKFFENTLFKNPLVVHPVDEYNDFELVEETEIDSLY